MRIWIRVRALGVTVAGLRRGVGVFIWGLCAAPAFAQQGGTQPAATPAPADSSQTTTVVVQGQRNDVSDRIDRRVYNIKDDPDSQAGTAGDVLDKLPSVTVTPSGGVALRGDSSVTILIDGKAPVNGNNFTKTLAAADIDRIEVITNPSAQYDAEGTGGIINIITKKRHPFGLSGNFTVRGSSLDQDGTNGSLSLTQGPWSITGRLNGGYFPGVFGSSSSETFPDTVTSQSHDHFDSTYGGGELEVSRKVGDDQTVTLNGSSYPNWSRVREQDTYQSASRAYTTQSRSAARNLYDREEFIYDLNDDKTGRHFTLDGTFGQFDSRNNLQTTETYTAPTVGQAIYGTRTHRWGPDDDLKADYESHPSTGHILTTGMEWTRNGSNEDDLYSDSGTIAGPHANGSSHLFEGTRDVTAAYVTYQHTLFAGWTMLPGLRAEYETLDIQSLGLTARPHDLRFYPTLHLSHALGKGKIKLSYSRRVDRPAVSQYDPARIFQTAVYASQGNPNLKAPQTDSYELGYEYSEGKVSYDATLYYRAETNLVSDFVQDLGNGVTLDSQINSGHSQNAGSDFTVKTPVSKHWKVSFNMDLFYTEVPLISGTGNATQGTVSYSSNSSLEYDTDKGDQVQASLGITGRQLTAQGYYAPTSHLDFVFKHNLTKKLALVVNVNDTLNGMKWEQVYNTASLRSRTVTPPNDRMIRISLTRTFGGPPGK